MDADVLEAARPLLARMSLVSYGGVAALERRRGGDSGRIGPPGERYPMDEQLADALERAPDAGAARAILEAAEAEFAAYVRRPLAPDTTETWEELAARIVGDGWAMSARECADRMRTSPTLVRRARMAEMRHPETGYPLPERRADLMGWARELDAVGLSVRQIEALTSVPKSTLHDRLK